MKGRGSRPGGRAGARGDGAGRAGKGPGRGPAGAARPRAKPRAGADTAAERRRLARLGPSLPETAAEAPRAGRTDAPRPARGEGAAAPSPKPKAKPAVAAGVQTLTVEPDEAGMRLDRFLEARLGAVSFSHLQRIVRKGEVRVDGGRVEPKARLDAGQAVRVPPLRAPEEAPPSPRAVSSDASFLRAITLYEDDDVMVLDKPAGLAVQGGSGTMRHVDGMLGSLQTRDGQRPRLVHRLDKETAGCLLIAKSRFAAAALAKTFRSRSARKVYWAVVAGVPRVKQGRVSTYLAKETTPDDARMAVARHGDEGAMHAVTYYAVVETAAQKLAWLSLKPVTGRTHQLRAHAAHIGHPILGDPKYFDIENWELPGGIQNRLHLLARRIVVPHPRGGRTIDVTAPVPAHMSQTFALLGFDASAYDPIVEAPES